LTWRCVPALVAMLSLATLADDRQPPLTDTPGDPGNGERVFLDRDRGHCLLCHAIAATDEPFQGNVGPPLDGIARRLDSAQIRYRIVDASRLNPDTVMPPYHRTHGLRQVGAAFRGLPVLGAQEVEDLIAWLVQRTGPES